MKYSFNEKELLDLFVSNDDSLPLFMHPYIKDGYVCARMMILSRCSCTRTSKMGMFAQRTTTKS